MEFITKLLETITKLLEQQISTNINKKNSLSIKSFSGFSSYSSIYEGSTLPERDDLQERVPGKSKDVFSSK